MLRPFSHVVSTLLITSVGVACGGQRANEAVTLHLPDTSLCHQTPLLIALPAGGGFAVNTGSMDSAALAAWLKTDLPQRKPGERAVFVLLDSSRSARELRWIVTGIERAGGRAYAAVPTCEYTIS